MKMQIKLKELKPNPYRDFIVDPIDQNQVAELTKSISEDGFWGGVVATEIDGDFHIVAGHHRVEAAIASGITEAEVFFNEFTPEKIVEIYARENATQRGNGGTAQTGSVAGALRLVAYKNMISLAADLVSQAAYAEMMSDEKHPQQFVEDGADHKGKNGVGEEQITHALADVPGIGLRKVREQLANLKASGHYARIINEVAARVEQEQKAAEEAAQAAAEEADRRAKELEAERVAAEAEETRLRKARIEANKLAREAKEKADRLRAEEEAKRLEAERIKQEELAKLKAEQIKKADDDIKAFKGKAAASVKSIDKAAKLATQAATIDVTFDLEGCAPLFKLPDHLNTYRKLVTGPSAQQHLLVKDQAALAEACLAAIRKNGREVTSASIKEVFNEQLLKAVRGQGKIDRVEEARLEAMDLHKKFGNAQDDFVRACKSLSTAAVRLQKLSEEMKPGGLVAKIDPDFIAELRNTHKTLSRLVEVIK